MYDALLPPDRERDLRVVSRFAIDYCPDSYINFLLVNVILDSEVLSF